MHVNLAYIAPIFVLLFIGYLYCCIKLYYIISAEHPEWLAHKAGREMLYTSFPKMLSPIISERVLAIAFSAKASQLNTPRAYIYCTTLRVIIVSGLLLFLSVFILPYV